MEEEVVSSDSFLREREKEVALAASLCYYLPHEDKCKREAYTFLLKMIIVKAKERGMGSMKEKGQYFVLKEKAVPEVLLRVVEAKRLIDSGKITSVQEATEQVGISRSSFYKYKDDIFPFHETAKGKTITMVIQLDDEPGLLSVVLKTVAEFHANILTIHQSIPINGIASLTLSVDVLPETGDMTEMVAHIEEQMGVHYVKILGRE